MPVLSKTFASIDEGNHGSQSSDPNNIHIQTNRNLGQASGAGHDPFPVPGGPRHGPSLSSSHLLLHREPGRLSRLALASGLPVGSSVELPAGDRLVDTGEGWGLGSEVQRRRSEVPEGGGGCHRRGVAEDR